MKESTFIFVLFKSKTKPQQKKKLVYNNNNNNNSFRKLKKSDELKIISKDI